LPFHSTVSAAGRPLPLARTVLDQYLVQRGQLVSRECWNPASPLIASLAEDGTGFVST